MDSKKIGKVIAKRRKEKGMTQGELAERLSVSNKTFVFTKYLFGPNK